MNAWRPDVVVLDEAQRIKNWESKTSRAVKKLAVPLRHRADRHAAGEQARRAVQHRAVRGRPPARPGVRVPARAPRAGRRRATSIGYRNLDKIRERLAPILLRRTRAEVLGQLPERTDSTVYVELTDAQRGPYEEQQANLARLLAKGVPDRPGPQAHPGLHRQHAAGVRQHVPVRQADQRLAEAGRVRRGGRRADVVGRPQGGRVQPVGDDAAQGGRGARPARRRVRAAARRDAGQGAARRSWSSSSTDRAAGCS